METSGTDHSTVADTLGFLGNHRWILLIGYLSLLNRGSTNEVRHLARVIRAMELGSSPRFIDTGDYESAYNALIQTHLPKLEGRGLIEYDENRKTVVARAKLEQFALLVTLSQLYVVSVTVESSDSILPHTYSTSSSLWTVSYRAGISQI